MQLTIVPTKITNFNRTESELQAFWLFGAFAAGKNSDYASRCLAKLLHKCGDQTPFEYLRSIGEGGIHNALVAARIGQYTRLHKFIVQSLELNLRTATLEQLMAVHGVGPKTARLFLLHSRPNCNCAVIDIHILKYIRQYVPTAPDQTPTNLKVYAELEKAFLHFIAIDYPHMSVADADLMLWTKYSGRLENDTVEPQLPV